MTRSPEEVLTEWLVLRSQEGDLAAWRKLVSLWQHRLYLHARRLTGQHEAARDVTQDAWLAMIRGIRRLDDPARFRAWAFRIVSNKATDWARRQARHRKMLQAARYEIDQPFPSPDKGQPANDAIHQVRRAIRQLPADRRALISMFYTEGMSLIEIADVLKIPVGTVKSRLYSIRQELKMLIERSQS